MTEHIRYLLALTMLDKVGPILARELISFFESAENLFNEKPQNLEKIPRIGSTLSQQVSSKKVIAQADKELELIAKHNISIIDYKSKSYPQRLLHCEDAPILFFNKGKTDFNAPKIISIVGTRNATQYGKEVCNSLISGLQKYSPTIVSGLAFGIDIHAHKEALLNGMQTIAVLGSTLTNITPTPHTKIAKQIEQHGSVISEYNTQMKFEKSFFVRRNRIIAGIADATIVVESKVKGGSLITADFAHGYGREVCAIPGNISATHSEGCNNLIKTNKAVLIENSEDIARLLNWDLQKKPTQQKLFLELSPEEDLIYKHLLAKGESSIDSICLSTQIPMNKTSAILLSLEFQGIVKALQGKRFKIT